MNKGQNTRGYERYLAFDIHRECILAGGQNEDQEWVLTPRRVSIAKFPEWAQKNLAQRGHRGPGNDHERVGDL